MTDTEMRPDVFRNQLDRALVNEPPLTSVDIYEAAGRRYVRRARVAIAAGCVMAAVVVPAAVVAVSDSIGGSDDVPVAANDAEIPESWRTEQGAGVEFSVPPDWAAGNQSQWCISGDA